MGTPDFSFPLALTFDDVLLRPGYSDFQRRDISLKTKITKSLTIAAPFISSPMDTVTESELSIALAKAGGIGIIHRNLTVAEQAAEVKKVKTKKLIVGAAIGSSDGYQERSEQLIKAGVDVIVVDSAHGFSLQVINATKYLKKKYPNIQIIAGNIATSDGAKALIEAGADGLRVGMGPGSICTTRIVSGMGVPQLTAVLDVAKVANSEGIPVIADGGVRYSGDIVKALAAGASAAMLGSLFASTPESPGKKVKLTSEQVPSRFKNILKSGQEFYWFKQYRGMGSVGAMNLGGKIQSEDEFHGKDYGDRILVAEGVEGLVPVDNGDIGEKLDQLIGGIRSGMYYVGAKTIPELWGKAKFNQITSASLQESHPHDILVTDPGKSYS